jgi:hypothetical protein
MLIIMSASQEEPTVFEANVWQTYQWSECPLAGCPVHRLLHKFANLRLSSHLYTTEQISFIYFYELW